MVAATAQLIIYFRDKNNLTSILDLANITGDGYDIADDLVYSGVPDARTFRLMLAAFLHDIGKTVVYERHGMEGATIIEDHTSTASYQLNLIAQSHGLQEFGSHDMFVLASFIYYHDQFGTLSTGEDGYLRLVELNSQLKRFAQCTGQQGWEKQSRQLLFDMWILNIADIMVSIRNKWQIQQELWYPTATELHAPHSAGWQYKNAIERIESFFYTPMRTPAAQPGDLNARVEREEQVAAGASVLTAQRSGVTLESKARVLLHDLACGLTLLDSHCKEEHGDDLDNLATKAYSVSYEHTVERIRRLVSASLMDKVSSLHAQAVDRDETDDLASKAASFFQALLDVNIKYIDTIIMQAIRSSGDFDDYCKRFAWVGKMDYALGFFQTIAIYAVEEAANEVVLRATEGDVKRKTGLVSIRSEKEFAAEPGYYMRVQAEHFLRNYVSVVVQIMSYLLFRDEKQSNPRCIEFSDAKKRLDNAKERIEKIISMNGPFHANKSIQLILQSVYTY